MARRAGIISSDLLSLPISTRSEDVMLTESHATTKNVAHQMAFLFPSSSSGGGGGGGLTKSASARGASLMKAFKLGDDDDDDGEDDDFRKGMLNSSLPSLHH